MKSQYCIKMITWLDAHKKWYATVRMGNNLTESKLSSSYLEAINFLCNYDHLSPILVFTKASNTPNVDSWTVPYSENCRKVKW